jgi:predicted XRE-type DNA-binding protein
MTQLSYNNIFEAITDDPAEAADLQFRADMMRALRALFESRNWTQAEIGKALGVPQPRVSELMRGKISTLSSDKLIGYLAKLGLRLRPVFQARRGSGLPIKCGVEALTRAA